MNEKFAKELSKKKYNLPVIGHFADKSVRFKSIIEASKFTGINYHLIFEAAINKIKSAKGVQWEYENGAHWLKYKSQYVRRQHNYMKLTGFNG